MLCDKAAIRLHLFVYTFLNAAEAVNMFVIVVLVFKKIEFFPLKASLVSWSELQSIARSLIIGGRHACML